MSYFKKTTADLKVRAELDVRKAERKLASVKEAARKAEAKLQAAAGEEAHNASQNVEKALRGETAMLYIAKNLGVYEDAVTAYAAALKIAEAEHAQAVEVLRQADAAHRVTLQHASARRLSDLIEGVLKEGDVFKAIANEDPKNLTTEGWEVPEAYLKEFAARAERLMNPPPPPTLDRSMILVRFIKSFPGVGMSGDRRSITAFSAGETAAFGAKEAAYLIERGFAVEVKPDTTDEEAA